MAAGVATLAITLPFLLPYQEAQRVFGFERTFGEVVLYSANVWSYITASENLRLFGTALRYYPHGEGETFLGFIPWLLAAVALVGLIWQRQPEQTRRLLRALCHCGASLVTGLLTLAVVTQLIAVISVFMFGGFDSGRSARAHRNDC